MTTDLQISVHLFSGWVSQISDENPRMRMIPHSKFPSKCAHARILVAIFGQPTGKSLYTPFHFTLNTSVCVWPSTSHIIIIIIIIMILNTPLKVQYVYVWGFGERMIKSYAVAIVYNICSVSEQMYDNKNAG